MKKSFAYMIAIVVVGFLIGVAYVVGYSLVTTGHLW